MRPAPLVLALLLFAPLAFAEVDVAPKSVGASFVSIELDWRILFPGTPPDEANFETFGFLDSAGQTVESFSADRPAVEKRDEFGNKLLEFAFTPPQAEEVVRLRARVRVDAEAARETAAGDLSRYLAASPYVSLDAELRAKALEVTAGAADDFERAVRLTEFAHNWVRYDGPGFGASIANASYVYRNRVGTCDEYSHLLLALLRSSGIPARFVAGLVYTGEVWGLHAWVEAAADREWVPLDPTYGEGGRIDATHVVLSRGVDQDDIKSEIRARAFRPGGLDLSGVEITPAARVNLTQASNFTAGRFTLEVQAPAGRVGESSLETVTAMVRNTGLEPLGVPLSLVAPPELRLLDERDRILYLPPGAERRADWRLLVPSNLEEGFTYRYPLRVESLGLERVSFLEAERGGARRTGEGLNLLELRSELRDGELRVFARVANAGNQPITNGTAVLSLAGREVTRAFAAGVGGTAELEFRLPAPAGMARAEGTLLLAGAQARLLSPVAIVFPTPTPRATPAPSVPLLPGVTVRPPSEEELLTYGAVALVVLLLVGYAISRRRAA